MFSIRVKTFSVYTHIIFINQNNSRSFARLGIFVVSYIYNCFKTQIIFPNVILYNVNNLLLHEISSYVQYESGFHFFI